MATRVVGVDLGSYGVRAVELSLSGGEATLERFAQVTLPPGAIRDGEVADAAAVSASVRRLWTEGGFKGKKVVIGVANQRVIVRMAEMPAMSEEDFTSALRFEAQDLIPIPVDDAILDFQILEDVVDNTDGEARMRVLLAAAQRDMVRSHLAAVEGAGLRASAVDLVPFALVRALNANAPAFDFDTRAEAIVCIGGGVTNVVVHERGVPRFVRVLLVGGDDVTDAIVRELDVQIDEAEALKRRADIS
jgi:type IV pilus assembly protein PilM